MAMTSTTVAGSGRNTNSIMQGWVDRGPWLYWDTLTFFAGTAASSQYNAFAVPIGSQDPITNLTKNKLQTNMVQSNSFPPPVCLVLNSIGFYFDSTWTKADIDLILTQYYFEFRIDNKIFHEGYLQMNPAGAGLAGVSTQTGESVYTNGIPAPGYARRYGDWSKYIAPLQRFSLVMNWQPYATAYGTAAAAPPTLTNGGALRVWLDGFTDRSVQ